MLLRVVRSPFTGSGVLEGLGERNTKRFNSRRLMTKERSFSAIGWWEGSERRNWRRRPGRAGPRPGSAKSWRRIQERRPWREPAGRRGGRCRYQSPGGLIQAQRTRRAGLERKRERDISPQTPCFLCDSRAELPDSAKGGGLQAEGAHPPRLLLAAPLPASPVGRRPRPPFPPPISLQPHRCGDLSDSFAFVNFSLIFSHPVRVNIPSSRGLLW